MTSEEDAAVGREGPMASTEGEGERRRRCGTTAKWKLALSARTRSHSCDVSLIGWSTPPNASLSI